MARRTMARKAPGLPSPGRRRAARPVLLAVGSWSLRRLVRGGRRLGLGTVLGLAVPRCYVGLKINRRLRLPLQPELSKYADQGIHEGLALSEQRDERPLPGVDQGLLLEEVSVGVVDIEAGADGQIHQGHLLGADRCLAPQVGE